MSEAGDDLADTAGVLLVVDKIKPLLKAREPSFQGGVLGELTALWLKQFAPHLRPRVLREHSKLIKRLTRLDDPWGQS